MKKENFLRMLENLDGPRASFLPIQLGLSQGEHITSGKKRRLNSFVTVSLI